MVQGLLLYVALPNLAFLLLAREFFINRPLLNADYLFLWLASSWLSRRAVIVIYAVLFDLDLILATESIYHYSTVETISGALSLLEHAPIVPLSIAAVLLALSLALLAIGLKRSIVRSTLSTRGRVLVGLAAIVLSSATVERALAPAGDPIEAVHAGRAIFGSSLIETGISSVELATASHRQQREGTETESVARDLSAMQSPPSSYNVALILVESQGLLKSEPDMRSVLAPLTGPAIRKRYSVRIGDVRFFGATMFGELRSLCHIYVPHTVPSELPRLDACLPNVLRRRGYETLSYHGFSRWFYERERWYPKIGFEHSYFAENLLPLAPPEGHCGSGFQELCDLWIADLVERELVAPSVHRKLVYWLTVNTHYPVPSELARESGLDCAASETLREHPDSCALARIHFRLYTRLAQMALNSNLPATRFIVVGDHMPPFPTLSERALYDDEHVPFVELTPIVSAAKGSR